MYIARKIWKFTLFFEQSSYSRPSIYARNSDRENLA